MKINYLYLFIVASLLNACLNGSDKVSVLIDNPTIKEITLLLDQEKISIPANSSIEKKVNFGNHTMQCGRLDTMIFVDRSNNILINPTLFSYVKEEVVYLNSELSLNKREYPKKMKTIPVNILMVEDSIPIHGPYKVITNELLIKEFDFGVNEIPKERIESDNSGPIHKIKLYRYEDFLSKVSNSNLVLHKRQQISKLNIKEKDLVEEKFDYFEARENEINKDIAKLPVPKRESMYRMGIMEINNEGIYSTVIMLADSTAIYLSSDGRYLRRKLKLSSKTTNQEKTDFVSSMSFLSNSYALIREYGKEVENFELPSKNEVIFHSLAKDAKYSKKINHDVLISNKIRSSKTRPIDLIYRQGFKTIKILDKE